MAGTISTPDAITISIPSWTNPDTWYTLTISEDRRVTCTCPGFRYRRHCKHATAELERLARWDERACWRCGVIAGRHAFNTETVYIGGRGYVTRHLCSDTRACEVRRATTAA